MQDINRIVQGPRHSNRRDRDMAKKTSITKPGKRRVGRPALADPEDYKDAKFTFRLHPDLRAELIREARSRGFTIAKVVEDALVNFVNRNGQKVDAIGRYVDKK